MRCSSRAKSPIGCVSLGATIVVSSPTSEYSTRYSMRPPVIPPAPSRLTAGVVNLVVRTSRRTVSSSATAASKRGLPNVRLTCARCSGVRRPCGTAAAAPVVGSDWLRRSYWSIALSRSIAPV